MRRLLNNSNEEFLDIYLAGGGKPTYVVGLLINIVEYVKQISSKHNILCA